MTWQLEVIGYVAGSLTTFCWLPQAWKIIMSGDTKAISLPTQFAFTMGCTLWTAYGALMGSPSIVVFNSLTAALSATIAVFKVRYG